MKYSEEFKSELKRLFPEEKDLHVSVESGDIFILSHLIKKTKYPLELMELVLDKRTPPKKILEAEILMSKQKYLTNIFIDEIIEKKIDKKGNIKSSIPESFMQDIIKMGGREDSVDFLSGLADMY